MSIGSSNIRWWCPLVSIERSFVWICFHKECAVSTSGRTLPYPSPWLWLYWWIWELPDYEVYGSRYKAQPSLLVIPAPNNSATTLISFLGGQMKCPGLDRVLGFRACYPFELEFSTLQLKYKSKNKSLPQPLRGNSFGWSHRLKMQTSPNDHVDDQTMKLQGYRACASRPSWLVMRWPPRAAWHGARHSKHGWEAVVSPASGQMRRLANIAPGWKNLSLVAFFFSASWGSWSVAC